MGTVELHTVYRFGQHRVKLQFSLLSFPNEAQVSLLIR